MKKHGFNTSTRKVSDIINIKGKKLQSLTGKKAKNTYSTMVRTPVA